MTDQFWKSARFRNKTPDSFVGNFFSGKNKASEERVGNSRSKLSEKSGCYFAEIASVDRLSNLEKPLDLVQKAENNRKNSGLFVTHTYARPRRLISIKRKKVENEDKSGGGKLIITPVSRNGVSGWKLTKINTLTPTRRNKSCVQNSFLQVISKKL